jgi:hypothetical protein
MNQPYPIISQTQLKEAERRGLWKMRGPSRDETEIPRLNPYEVRVFRVDGHFVVDDGRHKRDDNRIVNATSVSVVNMRRGAAIAATFEIDSQDAAKFAVQVNFTCSVIDPITVVRDGQNEASDSLLAYLKGYQPLFELGLKHPLADINTVRREAGLHVKAYMMVSPPQIPGMAISLANVQVMTPLELADYEKRRRNAAQERGLETDRLMGEQTRKQYEQEGAWVLKEREQEATHAYQEREQEAEEVRSLRQQESDHLAKLKEQEHDHLMGRRELRHRIAATTDLAQVVAGEPRQALLLAHARGELTADDFARRLRELDDADWQRARDVAEAERLAQERAAEIMRADAREKAALDREQAKEQRELEGEKELRALGWAYQEQRETTAYDRAKADRTEADARELRRERFKAHAEIRAELARRGYYDNYYVDAKDLMRETLEEPGTDVGTDAELRTTPELTAPDDTFQAGNLSGDDIREEDGY